MDGTPERFTSITMNISADHSDAALARKAILIADVSRGFYTGAFNGRINNYRIDSVGTFAVDTRADLKLVNSGYALTGTVRARSQRIDNANLRGLVDQNQCRRPGADG